MFDEEHDDPIKSKEIKRSVNIKDAAQVLLSNILFQNLISEILKNYAPAFYHLNKKYKKNTDWLNKTMLDIIKRQNNKKVGYLHYCQNSTG